MDTVAVPSRAVWEASTPRRGVARLCAALASIDPRTLALTRVGLGLLLLLDLAKRVPGISLWYTSAGLIPSHRMLWRPPHEWMLSYLFSLTRPSEVAVAFALSAVIYACFLVGYRTRLTHALSWFALLSLHTRVDMLANGGDYVLCTLLLWTLFLPLGRCASLDALRARLDAGGEAPRRDPEPVVSLAVLALMLQLAVIYAFNAVHKDGRTWHEGSAIHYVLWQSRIVTQLGAWLREVAPLALFQALVVGTLVIEYAAPLLILSPIGRPWTRRLAIALLWSLHGSIALVSNLGVFSPTMMVFATLLVSREDWSALRAWLGRPSATARALAAAIGAATACVARALSWLHAPAPSPAPSPGQRWLTRVAPLARECTVLVLMVAATSQVLVENGAITRRIHVQQPQVLRAIVSYLRLNQGWSMFAPEAPRSDMTIVIDATTVDHRHVDPYNAAVASVADPGLREVPARLGLDAFACDYTLRIPGEGLYHDLLADWVFAYHERTGRPSDRIVAFDAWVIENDSPAPGEQAPSHTRRRPFLSRRRAER